MSQIASLPCIEYPNGDAATEGGRPTSPHNIHQTHHFYIHIDYWGRSRGYAVSRGYCTGNHPINVPAICTQLQAPRDQQKYTYLRSTNGHFSQLPTKVNQEAMWKSFRAPVRPRPTQLSSTAACIATDRNGIPSLSPQADLRRYAVLIAVMNNLTQLRIQKLPAAQYTGPPVNIADVADVLCLFPASTEKWYCYYKGTLTETPTKRQG